MVAGCGCRNCVAWVAYSKHNYDNQEYRRQREKHRTFSSLPGTISWTLESRINIVIVVAIAAA